MIEMGRRVEESTSSSILLIQVFYCHWQSLIVQVHNITTMNATEEQIFIPEKGNRFVLGYYVAANFVGSWLCLLLVICLIRKKLKTAADVFLLGLCLGCIFMSVTCGIQCLLNLIHDGQFYGGDLACQLEATFHISSILVQFMSTACIGMAHYLVVVKNLKTLTAGKAMTIQTLIVLLSVSGTLLTGHYSTLNLMGKLYCFYKFGDVAIAYWLTLVLGLALIVIVVVYVSIFRVFYITRQQVQRLRGGIDEDTIRAAIKSSLLVLTLLVGWICAAIATIYELSRKESTPDGLVVAVGVGGVTHSVFVPVVYGYFVNRNHAAEFLYLLTCGKSPSSASASVHSLSSPSSARSALSTPPPSQPPLIVVVNGPLP